MEKSNDEKDTAAQKSFGESLGAVFAGLGASIDRDCYEAAIKADALEVYANKLIEFEGSEDDNALFSANYYLQNTLEGLITINLNVNDDVKFIIMNYDYVSAHLEQLFRKLEGFACCCDKSSTILGWLLHSMLHDKPIALNYEGEYTFHLPKSILKDHDSIMEYFYAIKRLKYGNYSSYMEVMVKIIRQNSEYKASLKAE